MVIAALLSALVAAPALAAETSKLSVGAGYGFDNGGVVSVHGDYDISDKANAPVKVRVGYDHYSLGYGWTGGNYTWSYNVFYGGAYYDFNKALKLDKKIHPFAGLGFGFGSVSCTGSAYCSSVIGSPSVGGLYYIAGVQYELTPKIDAEANFNGWGGLSIGANFKF